MYTGNSFQKAGDHMASDGEIIKDVAEQFQKVQAHMIIAKEDGEIKE